jgi:uncharacterized protein YifN (PemK superfamily)
MSLKFHPNPGTILICDYSTGFIIPEMVKRRPVVVVSPRLKHRNGLATVVPLSTTEPTPVELYHCVIDLIEPLPAPFDSPRMWVKADMLATVSFARLDLPRTQRDHEGKRRYLTVSLQPDQQRRVYASVLCALGLSRLTSQMT